MQERPQLGITIFEPQVKTEIAVYQETQDPDKKALILNTQIVQTREGVAIPSSIRNLALVVAEDQRGVDQYRSDAVASLSPENLVAVVNGLTTDEKEVIDPTSGAIRRVRLIEENMAFREVGMTDIISKSPKEVGIEALELEAFAELGERLVEDDLDYLERRQLIASIDGSITPAALRAISQRPDILAAFLRSANEFSDEDLRNYLKGIMQKSDNALL